MVIPCLIAEQQQDNGGLKGIKFTACNIYIYIHMFELSSGLKQMEINPWLIAWGVHHFWRERPPIIRMVYSWVNIMAMILGWWT